MGEIFSFYTVSSIPCVDHDFSTSISFLGSLYLFSFIRTVEMLLFLVKNKNTETYVSHLGVEKVVGTFVGNI